MFFVYLIPAIIVAVIILILSFLPGKDLPYFTIWDLIGSDKLGHLFMYMIFTIFLCYGFISDYSPLKIKERFKIIGALVGFSYGIIIEVIQGIFLVDRKADIFDVIFNLLGIIIALIIFPKLNKTVWYRKFDKCFKNIFD